MKPALTAMMISTLAVIASMIVGDMLISAISITVSVLKVAHAAMPRTPNVCTYRISWIR